MRTRPLPPPPVSSAFHHVPDDHFPVVDAKFMSANDIQSHLYRAFLDGTTADVSLHVRGTWEGTYRLHRVVLIQAVSITRRCAVRPLVILNIL